MMNTMQNLISNKAQGMSMTPITMTNSVPQEPVYNQKISQQPIHVPPSQRPNTTDYSSTPEQVEIMNEIPEYKNEEEAHSGLALDTSQLKSMIYKMKDQLESMLRVIEGKEVQLKKFYHPKADILSTGEKIIEGVFNGEQMVGGDGEEYKVSANYASKSKMVEGDLLKLIITNNGKFIYKQIAPIARKRITGELVADPAGNQWIVMAEGKPYRILTASVSFYKGKAGDDASILVAEDGMSSWGAVDNIIHKS